MVHPLVRRAPGMLPSFQKLLARMLFPQRPLAEALVRRPLPGFVHTLPARVRIKKIKQHLYGRQVNVVDHEHTATSQPSGTIVPVEHRGRKTMPAVDEEEIQLAWLQGRQHLVAEALVQGQSIGRNPTLTTVREQTLDLRCPGRNAGMLGTQQNKKQGRQTQAGLEGSRARPAVTSDEFITGPIGAPHPAFGVAQLSMDLRQIPEQLLDDLGS
ncbi:hypothetical protein THIOKS11940051 [Thiocapsa sp. KS1]|nr:hypothetical protein THIOKS11940051 [Thiocapsa sp. KS1]